MGEFDFAREFELCAETPIDWTKLDHRTVLVTGATGLVGKYMITVLLTRNRLADAGIRVIALGRNRGKFLSRFRDVEGADQVMFFEHDVQTPFSFDGRIDCIVHLASHTHPVLYATDPIGTEMGNILGAYHFLGLAAKNEGCRFVLASSGDVYGDQRNGDAYFSEGDCGYIDCNTLRAGYIEGKRASEALCNAFAEHSGVDFVTARLCRLYGSTMNLEDSKAISQFIKRAAAGQDIVLKSRGYQTFSYLYIADAVCGLLYIMTAGVSRDAYNVAENSQVYSLKDLAATLAELGGCQVVFDLPDAVEAKGASTFQTVKLDGTKLAGLGWRPMCEPREGFAWTLRCLKKGIA